MLTLPNLFTAYYNCRKNKRNSINALDFEINYESNLIKLYDEIIKREYEIWKSTVFIVKDPVKREVFAADFRDRIVHHYIASEIKPFLEKMFIFDSYSCRDQKWTSFWINRITKFIKSCSINYTKDCFILKLDIEWFFMNINKEILKNQVEKLFINNADLSDNKDLIYLIDKVILNNPTKNFNLKWNKDDWLWLPKNKSLFYSKQNTWLPIWNLTSQIFANIYLHELDIFIKNELKIRYYWRYVDDFVLIHEDKKYLIDCKEKIRIFLLDKLKLNLHPKKVYLQHYSKWVKYLWVYIKPFRRYILNRTKWNFYQKIQNINQVISDGKNNIDKINQNKFLSVINSYLGILQHYNTYKLRKNILLKNISWYFWNYFYISSSYKKIKMSKNNF